MLLGVVVGLTLYWIAPYPKLDSGETLPAVHQYLTDGVFQVLGKIFLRALMLLVVPVVFVSLVVGTSSLESIRQLGRLGSRTLLFYVSTTAIAISMALFLAGVIKPGANFDHSIGAAWEAPAAPSLSEVFIGIVPQNILGALVSGEMLQIIFAAILLGIALNLSGKAGQRIVAFFNDLNEVVMKIVDIVMWLAPIGVFALIARTFASQGYDSFEPLIGYFLVVLGVLLLQGLVVYPTLLTIFSRLNPVRFIKKMYPVQVFAFGTASSNATIPVNLDNAERRLGVKNSVASFTIPLGATVNMDGTAIMQGVATAFIAQAYGIPMGIGDYLIVVLMATLASVGTAGVPSVGLVTLAMVLRQVGLPVEGVGLILGIDRLLDMVRTAVNITGDAVVTCIVAKGEGALDESIYNNPAIPLESPDTSPQEVLRATKADS